MRSGERLRSRDSIWKQSAFRSTTATARSFATTLTRRPSVTSSPSEIVSTGAQNSRPRPFSVGAGWLADFSPASSSGWSTATSQRPFSRRSSTVALGSPRIWPAKSRLLLYFSSRFGQKNISVYSADFKPLMWNFNPSRNPKACFVKILVHAPTDKVLGIHYLGPDAAEVIQGFAVALKLGVTKR